MKAATGCGMEMDYGRKCFDGQKFVQKTRKI